jgi:hypothetical protein
MPGLRHRWLIVVAIIGLLAGAAAGGLLWGLVMHPVAFAEALGGGV